MLPTSRLGSFLYLNIYMGEGCEGVLIAQNWLHKHTNKREGILPADSSCTDAVALNLQETHNRQRGVWQRARVWDGAPRVTHWPRRFTFEEGTGKPCAVKSLPLPSSWPRHHSQGRTELCVPPASHTAPKHQGCAEIIVKQPPPQGWAEWGD